MLSDTLTIVKNPLRILRQERCHKSTDGTTVLTNVKWSTDQLFNDLSPRSA
jgi:hypothetical protein